MKPSPLALIGARLQRPATAPGAAARARVQAALDGILAHRLSCVTAPAGFGKSGELAHWAGRAAETGVRVCWLRLEAGEDDPGLGCAYLEAALAGADGERPGPGRALVRWPAPPQPDDVHAAVGRLLARLHASGEDTAGVVLVIDDAHWLEGAPVLAELLRRLLRAAPPEFHLVLAGRRRAFPLPGDLQAARQVLEIGSAELRLDLQERAGLARAAVGEDGPPAWLAWCAQVCGGWPMAELLAWRQLRPAGDPSALPARVPAILAELQAFLASEVLPALSARLQEFLLLAAVAGQLDAGLADALGAGEEGATLLDQLAAHGLLQALPDRPGGFALEPVLVACLRARLQRERPGQAALLHQRAALWLAERGDWPGAIGHALAGGDASRAAAWIERCGEQMLGAGSFQTLLDWIAALPAEAREARPRLQLLQAWACTFLHRRDEAAALLARLAQQRREAERDALAIEAVMHALADDSAQARALGEQALRLAPAPGSLADHAAHTAVIFGLAAASDFDQVERLRERQQPAPALDTVATLYRQNLFAFSAFHAGRLDPAGLIFEEVLARARASGPSAAQPAAVAAAYLAAIHYERDDPEQARLLLEGRRAQVGQGASLGALLQCLRIEARLAARQGQLDAGLAVLEEGELLGRRRGQRRLQAGCLGEALRLLLAGGRTLEADRVLRRLLSLGIRAPQERDSMAAEAWDDVRLAEARMLLAGNAPRRAVPVLRSLWQDLEAGGRAYLAARAAVVLVRALEAAGDPEGALEPLWQALRYGQQNGLVRTFADEGPALAGPVARLLSGGTLPPDVDAEYLRRLRLALDPVYARQAATPLAASAPAAGASAPRLSAREREILQYMARGLSNKEIARALGISPETVKWYLKHIYDKLQVSGRVQAVQAGLGILLAGSEGEGEGPP